MIKVNVFHLGLHENLRHNLDATENCSLKHTKNNTFGNSNETSQKERFNKMYGQEQ